MLLPFTMKITISAMLVAWSAMRSRYFETKSCAVPTTTSDGSLRHPAEDLGEHLRVHRIDRVVLLAHRQRQVGVLADERVEALAQHLAHGIGHPWQVHLQRRAASR